MSKSTTQNSGKLKDWLKMLSTLSGAYSEGTLRAYRADMQAFELWCRKTRRRALPATPKTIADYIAYETSIHTISTIRRRLAVIRKIHRLLKLENPVADEEVTNALRRAKRTKLVRPRQALGLTIELRNRLLNACPNTLQGKRDRALIALGYDTLCRRSELVHLQVGNLGPAKSGDTKILISRSKNDPFGEGRTGYVSAATHSLLRDWLSAARIQSGYLFRPLHSTRIGQASLHPYSVNRILKRIDAQAGLPAETIEQLSGHSMRVGTAQDLISCGVGLLPIMQAGGWKTPHVVGRYVEMADLTDYLREARSRGSLTPRSYPLC